jgi:hypothetical protein
MFLASAEHAKPKMAVQCSPDQKDQTGQPAKEWESTGGGLWYVDFPRRSNQKEVRLREEKFRSFPVELTSV